MSLRSNLPERAIKDFHFSDIYRSKVHDLIVGGAHTYSRGDDQWPELAPAAIDFGKGGRVWDIDGNEYVDCALALGSVGLGHAYPGVVDAVHEQLLRGNAFQRPAAIECELAEELLAILPGMERIKFAKNGSNVTSAAMKLARAFTGRDLIAFPKEGSFFSFDDWFIGATLVDSGVPDGIRNLSVTFKADDPNSLGKLFATYPGRIAAVITEPNTNGPDGMAVTKSLYDIAKRNGALFVLDEMVSGFRAQFPGCYPSAGFVPDLTTWGKAIGNGFSFSAIAGRADVMELGGLKQREHPRVFLLSATHGGESQSLAAARAVIREYRNHQVIEHQHSIVRIVADGMRKCVARHKISDCLSVFHLSWGASCAFRDRSGNVSPLLRTLFVQEMIGQGALFGGYFIACYAHTEKDVEDVLSAFDKACAVYAHALDHGAEDLLVGQPTKPVFRKYNGCTHPCKTLPCPKERECRAPDHVEAS